MVIKESMSDSMELDKKLYEYFLSGYKYDEKNSGEFDFSFTDDYSLDRFHVEFNKVTALMSSFYYDGSKLVTAFNSYDVNIQLDVIQHIIKLYGYSKQHDCGLQKDILGDFLLTYYNTICLNKRFDVKYKAVEEQFKNIFVNLNLESYFRQLFSETSLFYVFTVEYGVKNNMYISLDVVKKILNNIKNIEIKNKVIELLLNDDRYLLVLINYDSKLSLHKSYYLEFISRILKQEYGENDINSIFGKLIHSGCLADSEIKSVINLYVKKTNALCNKYKDKLFEFIGSLSEINSLKNSLTAVVDIDVLDGKYKVKIHECIINLLSLKRYLLLDEKYISSGLHEFSSTIEISDDKIKQFTDELVNNKFRIYSASALDFDSCVEEAIKYYSDFTLLSIIPHFSIDSRSQTYSTDVDFISKRSYSFEEYYESVGQEFTSNNKSKLQNTMSHGYYIELLRYLHRMFNMHQNIVISVLGKEKFMEIIQSLNDGLNCSHNSEYEMIVGNILAIEVNINKTLSKNSLNYSDDMAFNLSLLFTKYSDNKTARNGIMYLFYSLYEKSGPCLRNKAMHGTLINENLMVPLLISFSGLIFSSWLLNAK